MHCSTHATFRSTHYAPNAITVLPRRYFEIWTSDTAVDASDDDGDGGDGSSSGTFTKVHKSEVIKMTLNPAWTPIDINLDPTKWVNEHERAQHTGPARPVPLFFLNSDRRVSNIFLGYGVRMGEGSTILYESYHAWRTWQQLLSAASL